MTDTQMTAAAYNAYRAEQGWSEGEIAVLSEIEMRLWPAVLANPAGSRKRERAADQCSRALDTVNLEFSDWLDWSEGRDAARRRIDVELGEGRELVYLPTDYDDLDPIDGRAKLISKLHATNPTAQVEYLLRSPDGVRVAAVVVSSTPSWRPASEVLDIPADLTDRDAARVDSHLRESGRTLLSWDFAGRRQLVGRLAPTELVMRGRIAAELSRCSPWDVRIASTWRVGEEGTGELDTVAVLAPIAAQDGDKAADLWLRIARQLVGHEGWGAEYDHATGHVLMRSGVASNLPTMTEYPWSIIDDAEWGELAFGTDGFGRPVSVDLAQNPHVLVVGKTGAGKSICLESFIYSGLVHGFGLSIVDPTKRGLDFRWARPYVIPGGWGCQSYADALETLRMAYAEGQRRLDILDSLDLPKWTALSAEQRVEYGIRPLMVVVDEGTSMAKLEAALKNLAPDDPDRVEADEMNTIKARIMALLGKIARELRFVGVHLIFGTQRFSVADIGDGAGGLRENLGNRILLGRASSTAIGMAVMDPVDAMISFEQAHGVAASANDSSAKAREKRPGRGIVEMDGAATTAFQGVYADHETLATQLRARGVARRDDDGRPAPDPRTVVPDEIDWPDDDPEPESDTVTVDAGFSLADLDALTDEPDEPETVTPDAFAISPGDGFDLPATDTPTPAAPSSDPDDPFADSTDLPDTNAGKTATPTPINEIWS